MPATELTTDLVPPAERAGYWSDILWRAFGFDPDSQARATLDETITRLTAKRVSMTLPPADPELEEL